MTYYMSTSRSPLQIPRPASVAGGLAETIFIKGEKIVEGWSNVYGFGVLYPFVRYGAPWATRDKAIRGEIKCKCLYRIRVRPRP